VVAVECIFTWYGLADLWAQEGLPFVLGHALDMQAIHGGKAKHATLDAHKIAALRRGGMRPQADVYPAAMRATRDLLRRRIHLMRKRAELFAHVQNTNRQYHLPEIGTKIAYQANRDGVAERFADPAVQKSLEVDLALITYYEQLLTDLELTIGNSAKQHDAHTFYRLRSIPGVGKIFALVLLYAIHDIHRFPRVQDFGSYGRLVKSAKESAGKRLGTSGKKIGNAYLKWAFSEAAALCLRKNPAGQKRLARVEHKHGKGKALTILAHRRARAVYCMLKRQTAFEMEKFLHGYRSRAGEPDASLDTHGISLNRACLQSCLTASLNAKACLGLVSRSLGPLMGHPLWLLNKQRESRGGDVGCPSPEPDANWQAELASPRR
jgi:transposase